jgi:hypothetical protein
MKLPETPKGTKFENHCITGVWQWVVVGKAYYFGSRCVLSVESRLGEIVCFFLVWKNYLLTFFIVSLMHTSFEYWGNQIYQVFLFHCDFHVIFYKLLLHVRSWRFNHVAFMWALQFYLLHWGLCSLETWLMDIACIKHTISFHCISVTNVC